ncbi:MAG: hypothetical protein DIU54_006680 [Acidobacteriota bacterium]|jgi:hypothetical protein
MSTCPELHQALHILFEELVDGTPPRGGYMLNGDDPGLLASLDRLSADAASRSVDGGATIAAHVEHVAYGLSLMNRWAGGEPNPFATADWSAAWRTSTVDGQRWQQLRANLRREVERWAEAIARPRELTDVERCGMIGSVAHLAYHIGAIRQIAAGARGPKQPA